MKLTRKVLSILTMSLIFYSCLNFEDTKQSKKFTTSKGEVFYIKSINWGVTGDKQASIITTNSEKLNERKDTINAIIGLDPFLYKYNSDTLTLVFVDTVTYCIGDTIQSLKVNYITVNYDMFWEKYRNKLGYLFP